MIKYRGHSISDEFTGIGKPVAYVVRRLSACGVVGMSMMGPYPSVELAKAAIDAVHTLADILPAVGGFITEGMGTYRVLAHLGGTRLRVMSRVGICLEIDYADSGYRDPRNAWRPA